MKNYQKGNAILSAVIVSMGFAVTVTYFAESFMPFLDKKEANDEISIINAHVDAFNVFAFSNGGLPSVIDEKASASINELTDSVQKQMDYKFEANKDAKGKSYQLVAQAKNSEQAKRFLKIKSELKKRLGEKIIFKDACSLDNYANCIYTLKIN